MLLINLLNGKYLITGQGIMKYVCENIYLLLFLPFRSSTYPGDPDMREYRIYILTDNLFISVGAFKKVVKGAGEREREREREERIAVPGWDG